jgi:hypothetical protein
MYIFRVSSGEKITDYFTKSFSEEDFAEIFADDNFFDDIVNDADFDVDDAEPIEKRPKV